MRGMTSPEIRLSNSLLWNLISKLDFEAVHPLTYVTDILNARDLGGLLEGVNCNSSTVIMHPIQKSRILSLTLLVVLLMVI